MIIGIGVDLWGRAGGACAAFCTKVEKTVAVGKLKKVWMFWASAESMLPWAMIAAFRWQYLCLKVAIRFDTF